MKLALITGAAAASAMATTVVDGPYLQAGALGLLALVLVWLGKAAAKMLQLLLERFLATLDAHVAAVHELVVLVQAGQRTTAEQHAQVLAQVHAVHAAVTPLEVAVRTLAAADACPRVRTAHSGEHP